MITLPKLVRVGGYDPEGPPTYDPTLPTTVHMIGITARAWARRLDADALDCAARGFGADDEARKAARTELRRRGRCGATNRDGLTCQRAKGHTSALDHEHVRGRHRALWDYDTRPAPEAFPPPAGAYSADLGPVCRHCNSPIPDDEVGIRECLATTGGSCEAVPHASHTYPTGEGCCHVCDVDIDHPAAREPCAAPLASAF